MTPLTAAGVACPTERSVVMLLIIVMRFSKHELELLKKPCRHIKYKHGYIDASEIVELYDLGASINKIAFEYKATEPLIRKVLVENGSHIRNHSEAALAA